jgi:hypothetical protein
MTHEEWIADKLHESGNDSTLVKKKYEDFTAATGSEMNESSYSRLVDRMRVAMKIAMSKVKGGPFVSREVRGPDLTVTTRSHEIRTLEELLAYTRTDLEKYYVRDHVINSWGSEKNENFQVKAFLKEISPEVKSQREELDSMLEAMKASAPDYPRLSYPHLDSEYMLEIAIFDHHLGQLAWGKETMGEDYDVDIARNLALHAVDHMLKKADKYNISRILLPVGSDFFNVNSSLNTTYAGTPQSEDDRWMKTFTTGRKLWVDIIEQCRLVAPVDVIIVPGNHDFERAYYLGEAIQCWFNKTDDVNVDNSPPLRKYYEWGKNMIAFTHGDKEIKGAFPALLASEMKEMWARTTYREIHKGHLHTAKATAFQVLDSQFAVKEIILPSLVSRDDWHAGKGYLSRRESVAYVWSREFGKVASYFYRPEMSGM